jgi:mannose-1-phosphate guanylyltransferase/phosphomannomutase
MKAVVLAAGKGQRLKGILDNIPKPMAQIAGKPILQHNIEWLKKSGVTDIYINLHYLPEVITGHFGNGAVFGVRITYSREQTLLGTAGAVKKIALDHWQQNSREPFLVVYGDNLLSEFDLARLIKFHGEKQGIGTVCLYHKPEEVSKSGVALLDNTGRITKFIEKPAANQIASDLVNTGIYVLEPEILKYIPQDCSCDFGRDVFGKVLNSNESLYGLAMDANLIAIDTPQLFEKIVASRTAK